MLISSGNSTVQCACPSVHIQTTRRCILEEGYIHNYRCENLKPCRLPTASLVSPLHSLTEGTFASICACVRALSYLVMNGIVYNRCGSLKKCLVPTPTRNKQATWNGKRSDIVPRQRAEPTNVNKQLAPRRSLHSSNTDSSRGSIVVKALYYKPECRWFETRWGEWIVSTYLILTAALGSGIYSASNRNE
jgi:hypothetical protein